MQALVYTNTQTLVYREEQNPTEKPGESILIGPQTYIVTFLESIGTNNSLLLVLEL